jgi:2-haloacid dehalogenase
MPAASPSSLDFSRFSCLTFDCYGTLIDWETGLLGALRPLLRLHGLELEPGKIIELYAELELAAEKCSYRPYREILKGVVIGFGDRLGFRPSLQDLNSLPDSLPSWPPFPDTVAALRNLKTRYRLAVISNTDDDLFAHTARLFQTEFDWVITAQQARSYKPAYTIFRLALDRIALPKEKILHVAESRRHDIAPARELGLTTVWVNRHAGKKGPSASGSGVARPDLEVPDMQTLARLAMG